MVVAVIVNDASEAPQMIRWAYQFARVRADDIVVLNPVHEEGASRTIDVPLADDAQDEKPSLLINAVRNTVNCLPDVTTGAASEESTTPYIAMRILQDSDPARATLAEIAERGIELLIMPRHAPLDSGEDGESSLDRLLFRRAPCATMLLRPGKHSGEQCRDVLVPCARGPHCITALALADALVSRSNGELTALYVEPEIGDDAQEVGERILARIIAKALDEPRANITTQITTQIIVAKKRHAAIADACEESHDLLLIGASKRAIVRQLLFRTLPEQLVKRPEGPAVAVVRAPIPLANRLRQSLEYLLQSVVPQLQREHRVGLVERVQSNSQWNFDFITLMCLSAMIAALGLVQSSTAVVIGAMLVAPLMTPLLGVGLALVQGNWVLFRSSSHSVLLGFVLAFAIALVIGLLTPSLDNLTDEMLQRTSPSILDLGIAFASGLAAAYATSRPSLIAALPGVAIAAALLPPIATSGLAVALGDMRAGLGAALLFLVNMVAIVLASALSLWAVGIRSQHAHGRTYIWETAGASTFVVVTVALAIWLSFVPFARDVPPKLTQAVEEQIEKTPDTRLVSIKLTRFEQPRELLVTVAASEQAPQQLANQLAAAARRHYKASVRVKLVTQFVRQAER